MPRIFVATPDGLHTFDAQGRSGPVHHAGRVVTTVAPAGPELWAVVEGSEGWHSGDVDRWTRVADMAGHRGTCIAAIGGDGFVGFSWGRAFRVGGPGLSPGGAFAPA